MRLSRELAILLEAKAAKVGERRERKDGYVYEKQPDKTWIRVGETKLKKKQDARKSFKEKIAAFKEGIAAGTAGSPMMAFRDHAREGRQKRAKAFKRVDGLVSDLKSLAPPGAKVTGRVKEMESIIGKLILKPKEYKRPADLTDITGARIVAASIDDVYDAVKAISKRFEILENEDSIVKPKGAYRSVHLVIKDDDGEKKEVQVRTENQDTFANWSHDVYKPLKRKHKIALNKDKARIERFAKRMSNFFYAQDMGRNPPPPRRPNCPKVVEKAFGCI